MQDTRVQSLGWKDLLEKEMATHSSVLAWKIHGQKNLVGYSPWGRKESDTTERLSDLLNILFPYGFHSIECNSPSCTVGPCCSSKTGALNVKGNVIPDELVRGGGVILIKVFLSHLLDF